MDLGGAPFNMKSLKLTLGNMYKGETLFPRPLIQAMNVTLLPRSPDVVLPTCFTPLHAKTRSGT
jgi:hypothetical protein